MGLGDHPHDRQAEPGAGAFPAGLRAGEPLERVLEKGGRKAAPSSSTWSSHGPSTVAARRLHAARAVAERVVDEVPERLLEPEAVAVDAAAPVAALVGERASRSPRPAIGTGCATEARSSSASSVSTLERQPPALGAGDQQEVLGELGQAVDLLRSTSASPRGAPRASSAVPQRELELRAEQRERRSQLVAGIGDEVALALEGVLEPLEHLVQGLPEPLDLVPVAGTGSRSPGVSAEIAAARRRIDSTGRSASPASR